MHLFPSPYSLGPGAREGLSEDTGAGFSRFIFVSVLLHLLLALCCIHLNRRIAAPFFPGKEVIQIDLVSVPQRPDPTPDPEVPAPADGAPPAPAALPAEPTPPNAPPAPLEADPIQKPVAMKTASREKDRTDNTPGIPAPTESLLKPAVSSAQKIVKDNETRGGVSADTPISPADGPREDTGGDGTIHPDITESASRTVAGGVSSNGGGAGCNYVDENFYYVKDLITRGIVYPAVARRMKWQGTVVVSFVVLENGRVEDIRIVTGSGHGVLDKNVVATIKKVQPLPAPPAAAEFTMPIKYTLKP